MKLMTQGILTTAALALALTSGVAAPAFADGAASTRNILIGGAAAAAGTLLIINHNKQVHQRYADDARNQAEAQARANNAQAAYAAERRAYDNEVTVNAEYKHEVATQHALIASLRKNLALQKSRADRSSAQTRLNPQPAVAAATATELQRSANTAPAQGALRVASTSWGWGQF
jgi:hypothetical protein